MSVLIGGAVKHQGWHEIPSRLLRLHADIEIGSSEEGRRGVAPPWTNKDGGTRCLEGSDGQSGQ